MEGRLGREMTRAKTDADGRVRELATRRGRRSAWGVPAHVRYVGRTSASVGVETFYPEVSIVFVVRDPGQHYHVPLLLSPYGYSTYRGS